MPLQSGITLNPQLKCKRLKCWHSIACGAEVTWQRAASPFWSKRLRQIYPAGLSECRTNSRAPGKTWLIDSLKVYGEDVMPITFGPSGETCKVLSITKLLSALDFRGKSKLNLFSKIIILPSVIQRLARGGTAWATLSPGKTHDRLLDPWYLVLPPEKIVDNRMS